MSDISEYIKALRGPIIVAGASGFVGANLFKLIAAHRNDVFAIVRREKGWRLVDVPDEKVIEADLNDRLATLHMLDSIGPQTVLDCVAYGAYSFETEAALIYQTNFSAVVNLVELLMERGVAAYVHAGSSSEYGTNCSAPSELARCEPNSHYAVSKLATAEYLGFVGRHKAFPCVNLRLYSVYGPLEDTSRLIPVLVKHAVERKLPPLVDPRTSRDFVYVNDVCEAFVLAAARMNPDIYGSDLNIGSGHRTTIADLVDTASDVFGISDKPDFGTMQGRAWDLAEWYSDPARAEALVGWKAHTSMKEGLLATADWIRQIQIDSIPVVTTKKGQSSKKRSISAIIACYKDEQAIPIMHQRLSETFRKLGVDYEIIFVNDCSPDDSGEVIRDISQSDPRVIGVTHSRNFGSQMAFRSGMELSTKGSVVLLDGDLQDPPELIEALYHEWEQGADVVYGRRIKREMPWHWGLMYRLFYRVFAWFSYVKIPLDAGDFSLIDRRVVQWLLAFPERDLFMRGLRAYAGFKQVGVDYVRPERMFGVSTNSFFKNIDWAKKGIFSFSNVPLTMLTSAGIALLLFSIVAAVVVAGLRIFFPDIAPRGMTTLLIAVLMFGSMNLFAIGLIGEYIAKIMTEVKQRPRLIRASITRHGEVSELLPDGKLKP